MMNKELYKAAVNKIELDEEFKKKLAEKMKEPQKAKNRINYGMLAASAAVLILVAVFVQSKIGGLTDHRIATLSPGKSIALSDSKGTIFVNPSEGIRGSKLRIPADAYTKDYTMDQLQEFFGRDPLPEMPEGYMTDSDKTSITFDSKGKMIFMNMLLYSKDLQNPEAPSIRINLKKDTLPVNDCIYATKPVESIIGDTKVVLGVTTMGEKFDNAGNPTSTYKLYSAQFLYKGVGYNITTERADGQTMIDLLESIIK